MTTSHIETSPTGTIDPHALRAALVGGSTPSIEVVLAGPRGASR